MCQIHVKMVGHAHLYWITIHHAVVILPAYVREDIVVVPVKQTSMNVHRIHVYMVEHA